ncbi:hypothetical protein BJY16_007059 [Actinoplanes octamycinicus]|uniref:Uncharacterized protein n=1 Tax=Actinoplanes octamycinicus TaxID=135948 RepID=A0A7W7H419_9ACTN|nr:hypothetical protein [Actinoplanes octamycinicus]MBB4743600.1 hypothetical protein [Actinoplanes octamycinicus]GIE61025.1 hypothetical protein Aoc01nite_64270 [Actinoplanes octamycinicus]
MHILLDDNVPVSFHIFRIRSYFTDIDTSLEDTLSSTWDDFGHDGQSNGLCGAAVAGMLSFTTAKHTGSVPVRVELHDAEPTVDSAWDEVVEVSFIPRGADVQVQWDDSDGMPLAVESRPYRVRYCALNFVHDDEVEDAGDRYLIQFWPASPKPDHIVRQTSDAAAYWHQVARRRPSE